MGRGRAGLTAGSWAALGWAMVCAWRGFALGVGLHLGVQTPTGSMLVVGALSVASEAAPHLRLKGVLRRSAGCSDLSLDPCLLSPHSSMVRGLTSAYHPWTLLGGSGHIVSLPLIPRAGIWEKSSYSLPTYLSTLSSVHRSLISHSLPPHEPQHTRPPCPSPTLRVDQNSCPLSR